MQCRAAEQQHGQHHELRAPCVMMVRLMVEVIALSMICTVVILR